MKDKNKNKKSDLPGKKSSAVIGLLICGIFGLLLGMLIVAFDSEELIPSEFTALPSYFTVIIFILTYFIAISVHELTHFIVFKFGNIEMRALFLTIFLFIKENGAWRFRIKPNAVTAIGGIAIPDTPSIENEEKFKTVQKAFANAIIAAPIASILFFLITMLLSLPTYFMDVNEYLKSFIFTFDASLFIISLFLVLSCFIKSEVAIGDFPAYKMAKEDDFFTAIQLYQYMAFSSEPEDIRKNSGFLSDKINNYLHKEYDDKSLNIFTLSIVDYDLTLFLAGEEDKLTQPVKDYIEYFSDNVEILLTHKHKEVSKSLLFHIVCYLSLDESTRQKARNLFEIIMSKTKQRTKVINYFAKQAEHLLRIKDNSLFLNNKKNIRTSSAWGLWSVFPKYYEYECKINNLKMPGDL
ncbi:MAG: site-2 protease family protein [Bacillota bacterium]